MNQNISYVGNKEILELHKIAFLCSRNVPAEIILKCYDWAIEQREKGVCVMSGYHSKIEKDVFHYLAKGNQPIILMLARGMYKRIPVYLERMILGNRLLIISPFHKTNSRITAKNAEIRNSVILDMADEIVIGYANPDGSLAELIKRKFKKNKELRITFIR